MNEREAILEKYAKKLKRQLVNPRLFGLHWHNVLLILLILLVGSLAVLQTVHTGTMKSLEGTQFTVAVTTSVILWLFTVAGAVLLIRFLRPSAPPLLYNYPAGSEDYGYWGLFKDPLDIDTDTLQEALLRPGESPGGARVGPYLSRPGFHSN